MKQNTAKKKRYGKASMSEQQVLVSKIIKDIIEHSIKIEDFNCGHKKYQKIFENRLIKKEEIFILKDTNFSGKIYSSNESNHIQAFFVSFWLRNLLFFKNNVLYFCFILLWYFLSILFC